MTGVLVSGNIVLDTLVRPVEQIRWGASIWVESIERSLGGNGANTAYTLGLLGVPTRLLGMVGNDEPGGYLLAALASAGVDTRGVTRSKGLSAGTVALVKSDGERMFLHQPGASLEVFAEPIEFTSDLIAGVSHYHLGSPFALPRQRSHVAETLRRARAAGLITAVDTQWDSRGKWMEDFAAALPYIDILFMNQDESRMLTGHAGPASAARAVRGEGVRWAVMKLSGQGCAVFGPGTEAWAPAFDVPVLDTTGAGDCFAGAYLAMLARGGTHPEAARFANGVAALAIQKLGAVAGLLPFEETLQRIAGMALKPG
ncbi:MAG: carbohydrate kinase family protein [Candidatus Solibacter usitatus]|nr:carbohydrate kinase family protein [Candidatus Solibacter usitatus]